MASKNLIRVPRDLAAVTSFDRRRETPARDVGLAPDAAEKIWRSVEALYRTGLHPGVVLTVRRHGRVILDRAIGHARGNGPEDDRQPLVPLTPDAPICLFSASKALTAMLAHKLVERRLLKLDERVAEYIPEYAAHGKGNTTLRQLLSHRAGIPKLPIKHVDPGLFSNWDWIISELCATRPSSADGQQQSYHAVTAGYIVGEVVRRVSGRSLPDVMRETLAGPLGCTYFTYGLAPDVREQLAMSYSTGPKLVFPLSLVAKRALGLPFEELGPIANTDEFLSAVVPAANIHTTADESCRFYQMLLDGGEFEGRRLFNPETVAEAIRPVSKVQLDRTLLVPIRFSPAFVLGEKPFGLYGGNCPNAFGHLGFINIVCWADPDRDISVALLNTGKSMAPMSIPSLGRVVWSIGRHCPPVKRTSRP